MTNADIEKILKGLNSQRNFIQEQLLCGIIDSIDATNELNMINQKENLLIEKIVTEAHVTKDGVPRVIKYQTSKKLWETTLPGKRRIYAVSKELLYKKLFEYYGLSIVDNRIDALFKKALSEYSETLNPSPNTIIHLESDYKRFIDDEFKNKNIQTISKYDLKAYSQFLVKNNNLTKKAFSAYKTVLNLIFDYAVDKDIISSSPVSSIKNSVYYKDCIPDTHKAEDKIFSKEEINMITAEIRKRMFWNTYKGYFIRGYMMLFSIQTGLRAGELCSLKWDDISDEAIHIHSQQLCERNGKSKALNYRFVNWTKDEKGISKGGRFFPLLDEAKSILCELKDVQNKLGIISEYVFCDFDGKWITTMSYEKALRNLCLSLELSKTNNHAFRMALNTNVLIPLGLNEQERSDLLGHTPKVNQRNYTFATMNGFNKLLATQNKNDVTPNVTPKITNFRKKKSHESA